MLKQKTYVSLQFPTLIRRHETLIQSQSFSLSCEKHEEYKKGKPNDLISLYFHHKLTGEPAVITDEIKDNEIARCMDIKDKSQDIWFNEADILKANELIETQINQLSKLILVVDNSTDYKSRLVFKNGLCTFKRWVAQLNTLHAYIKNKNTEIIIGRPGTGKTHYTISRLPTLGERTLVVTLSNLVGANFVSRFNRSNTEGKCEFMSYTKARFTDIKHYDTVVFEEASMLSTNELPIILKCIEASNNIIFAGDTNQLPSFLGYGNILYGLLKEFPSNVTLLSKNHRCSQSVSDGMSSILNGQFPAVTDRNTFGTELGNYLKDKEDLIITAFENKTVINWNLICLKYLTGNDSDDLTQLFAVALDIDKITVPLRCTRNISHKEGNSLVYDMFNNELCYVMKEGSKYVISSKLFKHVMYYDNIESILKDFDIAYAMTVHKSQGLEWDYVFFVNDANSWNRTRNLCYVAYTRSKKNTYILTDSKYTGKTITYNNIFR